MRRFARWQQKAVDRLELSPGDTVIDVACGTGLNFPSLLDRIGATGKIVGIDLSPEMIAAARARVASKRWDNITLIEAAVEEAPIHTKAEAALFSFTHDVLQLPKAVTNLVAHLEPGSRVASVGAKYARGWNPVVNYFVRRSARPYVTTFDGLDRPWRELERYSRHGRSRRRLSPVARPIPPEADASPEAGVSASSLGSSSPWRRTWRPCAECPRRVSARRCRRARLARCRCSPARPTAAHAPRSGARRQFSRSRGRCACARPRKPPRESRRPRSANARPGAGRGRSRRIRRPCRGRGRSPRWR